MGRTGAMADCDGDGGGQWQWIVRDADSYSDVVSICGGMERGICQRTILLAVISSNRTPLVLFQASFRGLTGKAESRTYCLPLGQLTAEHSSSSDAHGTSEPWGS